MNRVILIGGAPCVGKSFVARKLAEDLKLPWISTDSIREQMRQIVRREDYPTLFDHADNTGKMAFSYLSSRTAQQIVDHQNTESAEVWKGVRALIETDYVWKSFIVEGVAVLPHLVVQLPKPNQDVKPFFLVDEDANRIRKTIFTRGLWDDADKYPDSVKEKEVGWVLAFNDYLKKEAAKYGYPIVKIDPKRKEYLKEIKRLFR
jgi:2-phosphoglycerate kinase